MAFVSIDDLELRLPRTLDLTERDRAEILLGDAEDLIREALARVGRDLDGEVATRPGFSFTVNRVIREMVSGAILLGANAGVKHVSSTTGAESDSVTFDRAYGAWGGVWLTDEQRRDLGLPGSTLPRWGFPAPWGWPEC